MPFAGGDRWRPRRCPVETKAGFAGLRSRSPKRTMSLSFKLCRSRMPIPRDGPAKIAGAEPHYATLGGQYG